MRTWMVEMRNSSRQSQYKLAGVLGISQSYYAAIEAGKRQTDMSYSMMERLAKAFKLPVQAVIEAESERRERQGGEGK